MPTSARARLSLAGNSVQDSPVLWFAVLHRAHITHDRALEDRARCALARCGVRVAYADGRLTNPLYLIRDQLHDLAEQLSRLLQASTTQS